MRFLITCIPGLGHFNPIAPVAHALRRAGHEVAVATAPSFAEVVRSEGLDFIPAGIDWDERRLLDTLPELRTIAASDRGEWMMKTLFLGRSPRRIIADLQAIVPAWRPDVIVSGSFEFGGPLVAEKAGLPYAAANYTIRWNRWILRHAVGRAMGRLRREAGLPPDPDLSAFGRYLDLCFAPPSWTFESALLNPTLTRLVTARVLAPDLPMRERLLGVRALFLQRLFARALRKHPELAELRQTTYFIGENEAGPQVKAGRPAWLQAMPSQPTVFVSLGTVLSGEYPDIFDKILTAVGDRPLNLIMTMGGKVDRGRFGAPPTNVRIVDFITQDELRELLPHVDLCINHAGYSSVMDGLLRGVPLLLLPLVADAPMNMQMCLSGGVTPCLPSEVWGLSPKGLPVIRAEKLTPDILRDAIMRALENPSYRKAAQRVRAELAARPGLGEAVRLLEGLARQKA